VCVRIRERKNRKNSTHTHNDTNSARNYTQLAIIIVFTCNFGGAGYVKDVVLDRGKL
jgi:hypothetical protein